MPGPAFGEESTAAPWPQGHLALLVETSHDVIVVVDSAFHILNVNHTVERMLGYQKTELLGKTFQSLFKEPFAISSETKLTDGVMGPLEVRRADGSGCFVELTATFIPWRGTPALVFTLRDVTGRKQMEEEREHLIQELQAALAKVKQLSGLLPMCASCKRIRDFQGYWEEVEAYISEHSDAEFTHSICPECRERLYPELGKAVKPEKRLIIE
ncbi:MAG: PAS domain S-box protein [Candidatus Hydrogenedentes bacterium]|nr:PAS domain S-box protein [Candidatus Hydrogenedentota bacterium]